MLILHDYLLLPGAGDSGDPNDEILLTNENEGKDTTDQLFVL